MMLINTRRDFLKIGLRTFGSIGAASVVGKLSQVNALAQSGCPSDYKALVCIFLFGGVDMNNVVIPVNTPASNANNSYANYAKIRGGLALAQSDLNLINTSKGDSYGLHPGFAELAGLYNTGSAGSGKVAILANVGTLVDPLTQAQYVGAQKPIPVNLFSHLDQQTAMQTSIAQGFATTGWGGRLADAMQGCNAGQFPMIVSVGGNALFNNGAQTNPAAVSPGATLGLAGYTTSAANVARLSALGNLLNFDNSFTMVGSANQISANGINQAGLLTSALASGKALTTKFPATQLGGEMAQIANIINVRSSLGVNRQIFFAFLGGFDTHDAELTTQTTLLPQVSQAMSAFYAATQEMGVDNNVVTFTESDFSRTFQPSGGATLGTDHAWGSHHFIMGGSVKGGDIYGKFPTQGLGAANSPDDANSRGIWIPTTSLDQYGATLATWFGVNPAQLSTVFPNLPNFTNPLPAFL
jgi:uncharacterized protein (DUF1501 family)